MSLIKSKNTKPELSLRSYLHKLGFRYRLHYPIAGSPDIVFPSKKIALFVHGCFWHQHGCKYSTVPKSNTKFWEKKLNANLDRDIAVKKSLKEERWKVLTAWECEIEKDVALVSYKLAKELKVT